MKRMSWVALMGAVLVFPGLAARADELADTETKILDAWKKHNTLISKFTLTTRQIQKDGVMSSKGEGTFCLDKREAGTVFRIDLQNTLARTVGDAVRSVEQKLTMMVDTEQHMYQVAEVKGRMTCRKVNMDPKVTPEPKALLEALRKDYTLKVAPEETVDGKKTYVIEGDLKQPKPTLATKFKVYFLQDSGAIAKIIQLDAAGEASETMTFTDIQLDVGFRPDHFVIELPPSVEIDDQTTPASQPATTSAPASTPASAPAKP